MARFYIGQPVVCVWPREKWLENGLNPRCPIPVLGAKYHVNAYDKDFTEYLSVKELGNFWYIEVAFAPITENQVQAIIAMGTDISDEVKRELEKAA